MRRPLSLLALLVLLGTPSAARAPAPAPKALPSPKAATTERDTAPRYSLGPLPPGAELGWAHAPYEDGDCSLCHERRDPKRPGRVLAPINELCFSCHEDSRAWLSGRVHAHEPAGKSCTLCHNPHNSPAPKLLHAKQQALCEGCHAAVARELDASRVIHLPVTEGDQCANCHDPHGSNVAKLLRASPFELCVSCHSLDDVRDVKGDRLANIGATLANNQVQHGAVKDCASCHAPHGSPNFRLLVDAYPAEFYAPFAPENYALCFECHKADIVREAETTTLTKFRDGSRNLHFVHVNREDRGRTCRACHEVHAGHQRHLVRDSVPYGPRGFLLELNFRPRPDGGQCERTCHATKRYSTVSAVNPVPAPQGAQAPP